MLPLLFCLIIQGNLEIQDDSLDYWYEIAEAYSDSSIAGDAWQEIIKFYMRAGEIEKAKNAVEEVKSKMTVNPSIYKKPYGYGLTSLFDYYLAAGDAATAEQYAKRLQSELGLTEAAELLYEIGQERTSREEDIGKLRAFWEQHGNESHRHISEFFPGPDLLYSLACVQFENKEYYQSAKVLLYLKYLPETEEAEAVRPEAMPLLSRVYYELERYDFAYEELSEWQKRYEESHPELAPEAYFNLGKSYYCLAEQEEDLETQKAYYKKALEAFRIIGVKYSESDFYEKAWNEIDDLIEKCRARLQSQD